MDLNEAIYLIRNKERMIKVNFRAGEGHSIEYLKGLIDEALRATKAELAKQVKERRYSKETAKAIHEALSTMPVVKEQEAHAVAIFPEYTMNELYIHAVAIDLDK